MELLMKDITMDHVMVGDRVRLGDGSVYVVSKLVKEGYDWYVVGLNTIPDFQYNEDMLRDGRSWSYNLYGNWGDPAHSIVAVTSMKSNGLTNIEIAAVGGLETLKTKPTNPKDMCGIKKAPMSTLSAAVLMEVGVAMLEGAVKYGRHNYRVVGVRASVYYDATMRHLMDWWEGTDTDPDSGIHHVTKAIASLVVLRDAMINDKLEDDRPPAIKAAWLQELNSKAEAILDRYKNHASPKHYTQKDLEDAE